MLATGVVISVSAWHLSRGQHVATMRKSLKFGLWGILVATAGVLLTGDQLGLAMVSTQPMKMAAAEAMFNSSCGADASFSLFSIGTPDGTGEIWSLRVPYLLAFLSTHDLNGCVEGINDLNAQYAQQFASTGLTEFTPVLWITYWAFRWMIGLGMLHAFVALVGLWITRKNAKREPAQWMWKIAIYSFPLSLGANIVGWVFTEMGRQPWIVFSLMTTKNGVSPGVSGVEVLISLISFTAIYAALAVVEVGLIVRAAKKGPDITEKHDEDAPVPSVVY
ncbi:MAG: hypothetical protein B7X41_19460 [Microbacterium sp. 14-71-5]|nr:MAG: hypothetical protein B7X41_19460 [Microbacterium sp. 14-71-5]